MMHYQIITDSACDLPKAMLQQLNVSTIPLRVMFRGESLEDSVDDGLQEIYAGLRNGEATSTSAINPTGWASVMEPVLQQGQDVLVLAFSSGLSATYQSAVIAAEELRETYPDRKIRVVDTLCAALGQGLLVWYACKQRDAGLGLDELAQWVENNKLHLCHWVTVNDLMHLKRGGRISATTAVVGTMLQIKPIIHVNDEGKLINVGKARGRKAAMQILVDKMKQLGEGFDNHTAFICHGDCLEDAEVVAGMIKERFGIEEFVMNHVGPVIGAHTGPGVVALFYVAKER